MPFYSLRFTLVFMAVAVAGAALLWFGILRLAGQPWATRRHLVYASMAAFGLTFGISVVSFGAVSAFLYFTALEVDRKEAGPADIRLTRRCLATWAAFALLPMALVASVNFVVDPFQFFRVSTPPRFSNLMQRYQQPGIIRNYPFGSIVVGNSLAGNLRADMFREAGLEPDVQNLSFWGSTLREAAYVVDLSLRTKPIDTVYWAIGRQWILEDYRYGEFPNCMYSALWSRFPYCYLIDGPVFRESVAVELSPLRRLSRADWVESLEEWKRVPFLGPRDPKALACEIQHWTKDDDVEALTRMARDNLHPVESSDIARLREIVLPILRANRQVRFKFIFTPLHLWQFWFDAAKRGGIQLRIELALIDSVINEPNVEFHDLTALTSLTHDSSRYDAMHYDFAGAREVVDALASGSMKITSLERHREMLRTEIEAGGEMVRQAYATKCP